MEDYNLPLPFRELTVKEIEMFTAEEVEMIREWMEKYYKAGASSLIRITSRPRTLGMEVHDESEADTPIVRGVRRDDSDGEDTDSA